MMRIGQEKDIQSGWPSQEGNKYLGGINSRVDVKLSKTKKSLI